MLAKVSLVKNARRGCRKSLPAASSSHASHVIANLFGITKPCIASHAFQLHLCSYVLVIVGIPWCMHVGIRAAWPGALLESWQGVLADLCVHMWDDTHPHCHSGTVRPSCVAIVVWWRRLVLRLWCGGVNLHCDCKPRPASWSVLTRLLSQCTLGTESCTPSWQSVVCHTQHQLTLKCLDQVVKHGNKPRHAVTSLF